MLPAVFPPAVLPDDAPLLLPLNRCQPPAPDADDGPAVDPGLDPTVDLPATPRLIADVLPDDVPDDGGEFTRCPVLLAAEAAGRDAGVLAARDIACLC
jgi:hypothetical protein